MEKSEIIKTNMTPKRNERLYTHTLPDEHVEWCMSKAIDARPK